MEIVVQDIDWTGKGVEVFNLGLHSTLREQLDGCWLALQRHC